MFPRACHREISMKTLLLLALVTLCYASYNLLVKVSSSHVPSPDLPPILATIGLQLAALSVSLVYLAYLLKAGVEVTLPGRVYGWAIAAGLCIGAAEVMYFYLFRGFDGDSPVAASIAIPFIVGGTIVIAVAVSHFIFRETLTAWQWLGVGLAFSGMVILATSTSTAGH